MRFCKTEIDKKNLTQKQVLLLDTTLRAVHFHNRVNVRLEPFLGCIEILYVAIFGSLSAQVGRLVAVTQLERVPPADALTVRVFVSSNKFKGAFEDVRVCFKCEQTCKGI